MRNFVCALLIVSLFLCATSANLQINAQGQEMDEQIIMSEEEERQARSNIAFTNLMIAFSEAGRFEIGSHYPDYYAGAYIDDEGGLIILTKHISETDKSQIKLICSGADLFFEEAQFSYNELIEYMMLIDSRLEDLREKKGKEIYAYSVSILDNDNMISIGLPNGLSEDRIKAIVDSIPDQVYSIYQIPDQFELQSGPGGSITSWGGDASYAYKATLSYGGSTFVGLVTAAHVLQDVGDTVWQGVTDIGIVKLMKNSGNVDAAFITLETPSNFNNLIGTIGLHSGVTVYPAVGSTIMKKGSYGTSSGTVISIQNTTYWAEDGNTMYNLLAHTASSVNGDSGGLIYTWYNSISYGVVGIIRGRLNSTGYYYATKASNLPWSISVY